MSVEFDPSGRVIGLSGSALDMLLPMHLWVGPGGKVNRAGPTFMKLLGSGDVIGRDVLDLIEIRRPHTIKSPTSLFALKGQRLSLVITSMVHLPLRGQVLPLPAGTGVLLNISLGVSFHAAVAERGLTLGDFSPCDHTVDLLYLREAVAAAAAQSNALTERLIAAQQAAEERALTDPLTGLANRRAMDAILSDLIAEGAENFAVMHIDLDFFKQINDSLGHAAGDHVLAEAARMLRDEVREDDIVARMGGDEFMILFRNCNDRRLLGRIAKRLIAGLERPISYEGRECQISASVGVAFSSVYDDPSVDQLLNDADVALYTSKREGRGRHTFFHGGLTGNAPVDRRRSAHRDIQVSADQGDGY